MHQSIGVIGGSTLSPRLREIARAIATGQVLILSMEGATSVRRNRELDKEAVGRALAVIEAAVKVPVHSFTDLKPEREEWRRGRPLRK